MQGHLVRVDVSRRVVTILGLLLLALHLLSGSIGERPVLVSLDSVPEHSEEPLEHADASEETESEERSDGADSLLVDGHDVVSHPDVDATSFEPHGSTGRALVHELEDPPRAASAS